MNDVTKQTHMNSHQQSLIYLHSAVLLFGGTALFAKLIGLGALDITVYRAGIAALVIWLLLMVRKQAVRLRSIKDYGIALLLGVIVGIHWVTYFAGMQLAGVTIGIIAFFTYPVITVFLEPLIERKKPKAKDIASAAVVMLGIYLLVPAGSGGSDVTLGIITGIVSAFFFATRNLIHKRHFIHYSGPQTMFYQTLVASLILCAFLQVPPTEVSAYDGGLLLLAGAVFTAMPHSLFAASLRELSATTAGLISCLQPLYGSILAIILLKERPDLLTLTGGTLVISAAFYETWSVSRKRRI